MLILLPFPLWIMALLLFDCCFIVFAIDDDEATQGTAATISVLAVLGVLQWLTVVKPFTYAYTHPLPVALGAAAYFFVGAGWSVVKWWFAEKARVRRAKRDLGETRWRTQKTRPATYKATVLVWIGYWPFSLVWTLLNDPFKRLVRWIYDELQRVYQRITDHVWDS